MDGNSYRSRVFTVFKDKALIKMFERVIFQTEIDFDSQSPETEFYFEI